MVNGWVNGWIICNLLLGLKFFLIKIFYLSTIICPITAYIKLKAKILRVHIKKGVASLK